VNYTSREVVRRLKQYDMFLNSLNLTTDDIQKERICDQLDKIEKQILLDTNTEYEEEYMQLVSLETKLFDEEKSRLRRLISLINERKEYLENRKLKHKDITGSLVELTTLLGEDKLLVFKKRLKIIEKYESNKVRQEEIIKDMKTIDVKISEASRSVKANMRLNDILENKMISLVSKALDKLELYSLIDRRDDILKKYESFGYAFSMAEDNLNGAKELSDTEMIFECEKMLSEIEMEYSKYKEEVNILELIDIYDKDVSSYDELLEKREKINVILENIEGSKLYSEINDELSKQYNTIKLENQDIKNYEKLKEDREKKNRILYEIEEENNSKEFKNVLDELIKSENKYREEQIRLARLQESKERERKILEEQKLEAARVRRQKLIEEARLKDQLERAEKLKELQDKTVINVKKDEKIEAKEEINNPLKNKSFDEMMVSNRTIDIDNDFDTDELFENTKIVPNKVDNSKLDFSKFEIPREDSLYQSVTKKEEERLDKLELEPLKEELPIWEEIEIKSEPTADLFKEEKTEEKIEIIEEKEEVKQKDSIYDILENNKNIIWKTTDTKKDINTIPVIGNNNLKPELLGKKKTSVSEEKIEKKEEGEILWKETL